MGSPLYMSPEQMTQRQVVDARSDIWSMGVVLYELLTADHPFEAETIEGLAVEIATRPHRPIRSLRPDLPEAIEAIVGRCLAKSAAQRLSSIAELAEALAPFGSSQATASAERVSRVLSLPSLSPTSQPTIDPILRPSAEAAQAATVAAPAAVKVSPLEATGSHSWAKTHGAPVLSAQPEPPAPEAPAVRRRSPVWVPLASAAALLAAGLLVMLGSAKPKGTEPTPVAASLVAPAASAQNSPQAEPPATASAQPPQDPAPQASAASAPAPAASQASNPKKPEAPSARLSPAKNTPPARQGRPRRFWRYVTGR
jgi:serine/threonine protein kinase